MIRVLLFILIFIGVSYAQSGRKYYIQLGSFKQFDLLERNINSLPKDLRSHIVIINSNGWFIPFAYYTTKRDALRRKLPLYKRYFPDAHINSSRYILNHQIVRNYTKGAKKQKIVKYAPKRYQQISTYTPNNYTTYTPSVTYETIPKKPKTIIPKSKPKDKKRYNYFTKRMLSGNHFYLTYKATKDTPDLLVKVTFYNHKVRYQPIIGDMNLREANYLVVDKKLYMFADTFSKNGAFSKIEKSTKDYILVSSWSNGQKLNTLRYYYNLNDAKKYLNKKTSGQLATALEDGEFDGLQQAFEGVNGVYIGVEDSY